MAARDTLSAGVASAKILIVGEQSTFKTTEDVLRAEYEAIWADTLPQTGFEAAYRAAVQKKEQAALCLQAAASAALRSRSAFYRFSRIAGCLRNFNTCRPYQAAAISADGCHAGSPRTRNRMRPISRTC